MPVPQAVPAAHEGGRAAGEGIEEAKAASASLREGEDGEGVGPGPSEFSLKPGELGA